LPDHSGDDSNNESDYKRSNKNVVRQNTNTGVPPLNMVALDKSKRIGTANTLIKRVFQATSRKRESLGTARAASRMVNQGKIKTNIGINLIDLTVKLIQFLYRYSEGNPRKCMDQ
jgi:hypothetical protein